MRFFKIFIFTLILGSSLNGFGQRYYSYKLEEFNDKGVYEGRFITYSEVLNYWNIIRSSYCPGFRIGVGFRTGGGKLKFVMSGGFRYLFMPKANIAYAFESDTLNFFPPTVSVPSDFLGGFFKFGIEYGEKHKIVANFGPGFGSQFTTLSRAQSFTGDENVYVDLIGVGTYPNTRYIPDVEETKTEVETTMDINLEVAYKMTFKNGLFWGLGFDVFVDNLFSTTIMIGLNTGVGYQFSRKAINK